MERPPRAVGNFRKGEERWIRKEKLGTVRLSWALETCTATKDRSETSRSYIASTVRGTGKRPQLENNPHLEDPAPLIDGVNTIDARGIERNLREHPAGRGGTNAQRKV